MKIKTRRNYSLTIVCLILGLILTWQFKSVYQNNKVSRDENVRTEELQERLLEEKSKSKDLEDKNAELTKQIEKIESAIGETGKLTEIFQKEMLNVKTIAGLTDVKGKGIIITLDNGYDARFKEKVIVTEYDILSILNELRASDAQAVSINGERIVAMTEVREAGNYIMINGKQMLPPFEIKAISDPDELESSLKIIGGVIDTLQEVNFLEVSIEKSNEIKISKVKDNGSIINIDKLTPLKE